MMCLCQLARSPAPSPLSLLASSSCFNKWPPLLVGLAACLQLWLKLFGESGTAPVPVHGPSLGDGEEEEEEEAVLDVA